MILKLLIGALVAYAGWVIWRGPKRRRSAPIMPASYNGSDNDVMAARALLGLDAGADDAAIRAAYRRIAAAVHPDRGGSAELARRVNEARDLLLKRGPDSAV